jgi:nucleoside permease NupC
MFLDAAKTMAPYIYITIVKCVIIIAHIETFSVHIPGSVMAAYISFGAQPVHLLTASVMSAPAALCISKLFYPETEQSKTTAENMAMVKG